MCSECDKCGSRYYRYVPPEKDAGAAIIASAWMMTVQKVIETAIPRGNRIATRSGEGAISS